MPVGESILKWSRPWKGAHTAATLPLSAARCKHI
jgi:hypothetical protein